MKRQHEAKRVGGKEKGVHRLRHNYASGITVLMQSS